MSAKMGRPPKSENERKVRDSTYYDPDVHAWLKEMSSKRNASISSLVNVIIRERMKKESSK